ncbi:MAG: hypothetical protein FWD05_11255, partial [Oscillospiraceae bacterium]|nr:hypothetical protein [Oscillospiraceae bacterium]
MKVKKALAVILMTLLVLQVALPAMGMASASEDVDIYAISDYVGAADVTTSEVLSEEEAVETPEVELPAVDIPTVDVPVVETPDADVPDSELNQGEELVNEEEYEYGEDGYVGIEPMSFERPVGLPATTHTATDDATLRIALNASGTRVIRVTQDITLAAAVLPHAGASTTVHIYSWCPIEGYGASFALIRADGHANRHFEMAGSRILHLWNIRLTRNPAAPVDGRIPAGGPANNGGGISMGASGTRLYMHAGSEISHARAAGRGGGLIITNGLATINPGATISHNFSAQTGNGGGGGVFIDSGGGRLTTRGATFSYNHANGSGGGISVAHNQTGAAAVLNAYDITLRGNSANNFGGGIHSNTNSNVTVEGLTIIENNIATNGGGMRFFSASATNITLSPGSIVRGNVARQNGAGISIINANNVGLRVDGVLFEGNMAAGEGGAIRHEGTDLAAARGVHITNSTFRNNRALNGGAISLVLSANNNNLPTNAATDRLRITNTTFEGNRATAGLLIDENLAARNVGNPHFAGGQVGSVVWVGPRTNIDGSVAAIEERNHIWNNYDVVTRNRIEGRHIYFNTLGTAHARSTMEAELTQTRRSSNHTVTAPGMATTAPHDINPAMPVDSGDGVIRNSLTNVRITYVPWNADILGWYNTQITRAWVGDPVDGSMVETYVRTAIPGSAGAMQQIGVNVDQHTRIEARIDYRYHDVRFEANLSTPTTGGTVDGLPSVTRNLRESRPGGGAVNGAPIGIPPVTAARDGWMFAGWTHNGNPITANEIAAMYVSGPLVFVANFAPGLRIANVPDNLTHSGQSATVAGGNLNIPGPNPVANNTSVTLTAGGVTENHYFLGWYRMPYGATPPTVGTNINTLVQDNLVRPGADRPNPYNVGYTFGMPNAGIQYLALWGADSIIGGEAARITFHAYGNGNFGLDGDGNAITELVVPVAFNTNVNLSAVEAYLDGIDEVGAFAFWGWFTAENLATGIGRSDLDAEGRRDGFRRPAVGHTGWEHISVDIPEGG